MNETRVVEVADDIYAKSNSVFATDEIQFISFYDSTKEKHPYYYHGGIDNRFYLLLGLAKAASGARDKADVNQKINTHLFRYQIITEFLNSTEKMWSLDSLRNPRVIEELSFFLFFLRNFSTKLFGSSTKD